MTHTNRRHHVVTAIVLMCTLRIVPSDDCQTDINTIFFLISFSQFSNFIVENGQLF